MLFFFACWLIIIAFDYNIHAPKFVLRGKHFFYWGNVRYARVEPPPLPTMLRSVEFSFDLCSFPTYNSANSNNNKKIASRICCLLLYTSCMCVFGRDTARLFRLDERRAKWAKHIDRNVQESLKTDAVCTASALYFYEKKSQLVGMISTNLPMIFVLFCFRIGQLSLDLSTKVWRRFKSFIVRFNSRKGKGDVRCLSVVLLPPNFCVAIMKFTVQSIPTRVSYF